MDEEHPSEELVGQAGAGHVIKRELGSLSEGVRRVLECLGAGFRTLFERAELH